MKILTKIIIFALVFSPVFLLASTVLPSAVLNTATVTKTYYYSFPNDGYAKLVSGHLPEGIEIRHSAATQECAAGQVCNLPRASLVGRPTQSGNFVFTIAIGSTTESYVLPVVSKDMPSSCLRLSRNLGVGYRGGDVLNLQKFLVGEGYLRADPTGFFGSLTKIAVQKFQKDNNIVQTGFVGYLSKEKLKTLTCGASGL